MLFRKSLSSSHSSRINLVTVRHGVFSNLPLNNVSNAFIKPLYIARGTRSMASGFALVLTLIIISVIGGVAFGVGRLTLREFRQTMRFQDSQSALQAAEAGIEDGLVRFRFERNTQVPVKDASVTGCGAIDAEPTKDTRYVLRVNLSTGTRQCVDPSVSAPPNPTELVYDLKVYYKGKSLGEFSSQNLSASQSPELKKDDTLHITGIGSEVTQLDLRYVPVEVPQVPDSTPRAQINYLDSSGAKVEEPMLVPKGLLENKFSLKSGFQLGLDPTKDIQSIEFRPLAYNIKIASKTNVDKIDFGFSTIEVIGYFNNTKRKLRTDINRKTGSTQGIYNFVLFSSTGNLGQ